MNTKFSFDMSELEKSLAGAVSRIGVASVGITRAEAQEIMEESHAQVPKDTYTLANDTFINTTHSLIKATTTFGYTGDAYNSREGKSTSEYMIEVHEDLSKNHPVGKAKFLEDPVIDYSARVSTNLGEAISKALKGLFHR